MRLGTRLRKIERHCAASKSDLSKLSDDELDALLREQFEQLGIDWASFKNDPTGVIEEAFEGVEDDEGSIAGLLKAIAEADIDWLRAERLPPAGW